MNKIYSNIDKVKGEQCDLCKNITTQDLYEWDSKHLCRDCYEKESVKDMGTQN